MSVIEILFLFISNLQFFCGEPARFSEVEAIGYTQMFIRR